MTEFSDFACLLAKNDADGAISFFRKNAPEILREYRRLLQEENYNEYWEQEHTVFDELVNSRLSRGDDSANDIIRRLLSERAFINEPTPDGFTPVSLLSYAGSFDLVKHAVECGADPNKGSHAALTGAVYNRELPKRWEQIVTFLLDHGADPNGSVGAKPPLFPAIANNHRAAIRLLAARGADVNRIHDIPNWGDFSGTALHWAIRSAHTDHTDLETANLLLELGGDPTIKNKSGSGPIDFAFDKDLEENENVRPLINLFSSRDHWLRASWKLNPAPPFRDNPARTEPNRRSDSPASVWHGVEYRLGDRVEVIQRRQWMNPMPPDSLDTHIHNREVNALPGLTGTIDGFEPGISGSSWRALVEWDPGNWEETDNYGKMIKLPSCRDAISPENLKIIEIEENLRGTGQTATRSSGTRIESDNGGAKSISWKLVAGMAVAFVTLFLLLG